MFEADLLTLLEAPCGIVKLAEKLFGENDVQCSRDLTGSPKMKLGLARR